MLKFSVVISVFNKENYIAETLRSVLNQTFTDFEIVILNDGSTDNSEAEILKFNDPRIKYYSQENQGAAAGRNAAIQKAENEYIALLDADDYWYPFYLEEQKKAIEAFPEEAVFATATQTKKNGRVYNNPYSTISSPITPIKVNYFEGSFLFSLLHSSSTVLHKKVFNKIGMYDPAIKSGQDTDLYIRIGLEYDVVFSGRICAIYIIREKSLFQTSKKIADKVNFEAYEHLENNNPGLKKFLDLNRYSLCILAKMEGNKEAFQKNLQKIDLENLSNKQRFLLKQNKTILKYLLKTKNGLEKLGLRLGTFK
ncbi:MAG: glycosyltransferase family 2 protein [Aequorivita sp.]